MQSAKETASNVAASAKAGMEKTKATMQEKGEKMTSRDPLRKDLAAEKKDERILEAERQKQETRQHNAATKQAASVGGVQPTGYSTGGDFSTAQHPTTTTAEGGALGAEYPQGTHAGGAARTGLGSQGPTADTGARTGHVL